MIIEPHGVCYCPDAEVINKICQKCGGLNEKEQEAKPQRTTEEKKCQK